MSVPGIPPRLWQRVARARHRLLMLDYDGTLAPLQPNRAEARPAPRTLELLHALGSGSLTSLAVVSGRPVDDLPGLLGPIRATLIGEHGWEERSLDGAVVRAPLDAEGRDLIEAAARLAHAQGLGGRLERKRTGVMLHTRGAEEPEARAAERAARELWAPLVAKTLAVVDRVSGGVEFRLRERHKGTAVRDLIARGEPGTLAVYVGDDVTDEDAFEAVRDHGFGVRVGDDAPSVATARLSIQALVPAFLEEWLRVAAESAHG